MIEVWWVTIGDGDYNFDLSHEIRGAKPAAVDHHISLSLKLLQAFKPPFEKHWEKTEPI